VARVGGRVRGVATGMAWAAGAKPRRGMALTSFFCGWLLESLFGRDLVSRPFSIFRSCSHESILVAFCWRSLRDAHPSCSANRYLMSSFRAW